MLALGNRARAGEQPIEIRYGSLAYRTSARELGLPTSVEAASRGRFGQSLLSDQFINFFGNLAERLSSSKTSSLWLRLGSNSGYLSMMPWERLLGRMQPIEVRRLPYFALWPVFPRQEYHTALLFDPVAAPPPSFFEHLDRNALHESLRPIGGTIHLFGLPTIRTYIESLDYLRTDGQLNVRIQVSPSNWPTESPRSEKLSTGGVLDPWLRWVSDKLEDQYVDRVVFIADGHFVQGRGRTRARPP